MGGMFIFVRRLLNCILRSVWLFGPEEKEGAQEALPFSFPPGTPSKNPLAEKFLPVKVDVLKRISRLQLHFLLSAMVAVAAGGTPAWSQALKAAPVARVGINGKYVAFSETSGESDFRHLFNLNTMQLDDERLPYLNFRGIKKAQKENSLTYSATGNQALLDLRRLGQSIHQVDWSHFKGKQHLVFGFLSEGFWISGGRDGALCVYDLDAARVATLVGHSADVTSLACDKDLLVSADASGLMMLWDLKEIRQGKRTISPILYMVCGRDGSWLISSSEGIYSASAGGEGLTRAFIPSILSGDVAALAREDSGLLAEKLTSRTRYYRDLSLVLGDAKGAMSPPEVSLVNAVEKSQTRDLEILARVCDRGGGVASATLYLRGAPVDIEEAGRGISLKPATEDACSVYSRVVSLQNGSNDIVLVARNKFGVESAPARTSVSYTDKLEKRDLYILTLAVSDYKGDSHDLRYPVKDAMAIRNALAEDGYGYFGHVHSYALYDGDVTAKGVRALFHKLSDKVRDNDALVVFLAGHGIFSEQNSQYYFLPYDFDDRSLEEATKTGLSSSDFQRAMSEIKSAQTLVLIDTCQSGGFEGTADISGDITAGQLSFAHRLGRASLMASSKEQVAFEGYKGHGAFSFVVLEGLGGEADLTHDGKISVDELSTFVGMKLPLLTERVWGFRQEATQNMTGYNFVLGRTSSPNCVAN